MNPEPPLFVLYYAACLLNFAAALWMAASIRFMSATDPWLARFVIMVAGMVHVIITVSMFKNPDYTGLFPSLHAGVDPSKIPDAPNLVWWWAIAVLGVLVLLQPLKLLGAPLLRIATYLGAVLAFWGAYIVFEGQHAFGELATYYGFFGANLAAAIGMVLMGLFSQDLLQRKRVIFMSVGAIYAALVVTAVYTMQMILESPYD